MKIDIKFDLDEKLVSTAVLLHWRYLYVSKRENLYAIVSLFCLLCGCFVPVLSCFFPAIVCAYVLIFLILWSVRFRLRHLMLIKKKSYLREISDKTLHLQFHDSGIRFEHSLFSYERDWGELAAAVISDKVVLLIWSEFEFTIVPVCCWDNREITILLDRCEELKLTSTRARQMYRFSHAGASRTLSVLRRLQRSRNNLNGECGGGKPPIILFESHVDGPNKSYGLVLFMIPCYTLFVFGACFAVLSIILVFIYYIGIYLFFCIVVIGNHVFAPSGDIVATYA